MQATTCTENAAISIIQNTKFRNSQQCHNTKYKIIQISTKYQAYE